MGARRRLTVLADMKETEGANLLAQTLREELPMPEIERTILRKLLRAVGQRHKAAPFVQARLVDQANRPHLGARDSTAQTLTTRKLQLPILGAAIPGSQKLDLTA